MKNLITLIMFVIVGSGIVSAQSKNYVESLTPSQIKNLENAILSENDGLCRSAIYLAGKYQLPQVEKALITKLEKEEDPLNRVFIARVLHRINSDEGMKYIQQMTKNDSNERVRVICSMLCEDYYKTRVNPVATLNQ
ncbi:MAG: HEAT repeat domain-containing protein [Bacteroidetes bacterium]|nr:HEAT repeat domain-containing protein [Bacteroidota bacterium]